MNEKTEERGSTFLTLLSVAFIVLKLCKVIEWSWVWVLAPVWVPWAVLIVLAIVGGVIEAAERKKGG